MEELSNIAAQVAASECGLHQSSTGDLGDLGAGDAALADASGSGEPKSPTGDQVEQAGDSGAEKKSEGVDVSQEGADDVPVSSSDSTPVKKRPGRKKRKRDVSPDREVEVEETAIAGRTRRASRSQTNIRLTEYHVIELDKAARQGLTSSPEDLRRRQKISKRLGIPEEAIRNWLELSQKTQEPPRARRKLSSAKQSAPEQNLLETLASLESSPKLTATSSESVKVPENLSESRLEQSKVAINAFLDSEAGSDQIASEVKDSAVGEKKGRGRKRKSEVDNSNEIAKAKSESQTAQSSVSEGSAPIAQSLSKRRRTASFVLTPYQELLLESARVEGLTASDADMDRRALLSQETGIPEQKILHWLRSRIEVGSEPTKDEGAEPVVIQEPPPKRKPGRPRRLDKVVPPVDSTPRPIGRPRKSKLPASSDASGATETEEAVETSAVPVEQPPEPQPQVVDSTPQAIVEPIEEDLFFGAEPVDVLDMRLSLEEAEEVLSEFSSQAFLADELEFCNQCRELLGSIKLLHRQIERTCKSLPEMNHDILKEVTKVWEGIQELKSFSKN